MWPFTKRHIHTPTKVKEIQLTAYTEADGDAECLIEIYQCTTCGALAQKPAVMKKRAEPDLGI